MQRPFYTIPEAGRLLRLPSTAPIYYAQRCGRLPFLIQLGRQYAVPAERLESLLRVIGPQLRAVDYATAAQRINELNEEHVIEV